MGAQWREGLTAYGEAWSVEDQKGFAKMLLLELAFDRCIGVYQVVNGRSGVPGTRKGVYVPEKCPRTGNKSKYNVSKTKVQGGRM